ncbi:MAG: methyltransferase domain-containing protein [Thermoplasmata archaeon]
MKTQKENIRTRVKEQYAEAARASPSSEAACCDDNYSSAELSAIPTESVLGLGSGNPVRHADLKSGEVVIDLGSGAGIDVFLAAGRVGPQGRAIGVDMTPDMVARARRAAESRGIANVEFHEALIEKLPLEDDSVDVVLSNCVINLSPDKPSVFREAFRVLKPGGRLVISDIVQEHPLNLFADGSSCVATAMVRADYLEAIHASGFPNVEILDDKPSLQDSQGVAASAITLRAEKPAKT